MKKKLRFHYCPADAFLNIISKGAIWFSDLNSMDDPNEIKYVWDSYMEYLYSKRSGNGLSIDSVIEQQLDRILYFSLSFTRESGSAYMWENYTNRGEGLAIGFGERDIEDWCKNIHGSFNGWKGGPMSEVDTAVYRRIRYRSYSGMRMDLDRMVRKDRSSDESFPAYQDIFLNAPFVKKKEYRFEKEYRALISMWPPFGYFEDFPYNVCYSPDGDSDSSNRYEMKWRSNAYSDYYPYFSVPFEKKMVKKILLGPSCVYDEESVEFILSQYGYPRDIVIEKARCRL